MSKDDQRQSDSFRKLQRQKMKDLWQNTKFQVQMHQKRKRNTSGYLGVFAQQGGWIARIMYQGKRYYLGFYHDQIEAAKAYNEKALELFGETAQLNSIEIE